MDRSSTQKVLYNMASQSALDPDIVDLLMANFDEINVMREDAQRVAVVEYAEICSKVILLVAGNA